MTIVRAIGAVRAGKVRSRATGTRESLTTTRMRDAGPTRARRRMLGLTARFDSVAAMATGWLGWGHGFNARVLFALIRRGRCWRC